MIKGNIWLVERNIRGAYVIYGAIGVKQYYGYTKAEAIALYQSDCKEIEVETDANKEQK